MVEEGGNLVELAAAALVGMILGFVVVFLCVTIFAGLVDWMRRRHS